jgi:hypothetical protein
MPATPTMHPGAPHSLPPFITAPGDTDVLLVAMALLLLVSVFAVGILFLRLHTLPERMAHRSQKLQFEIVAVLGLISLFTHQHIFWIAGLLLALIDLPDFGSPLGRIARGVETMAGIEPEEDGIEDRSPPPAGSHAPEPDPARPPVPASAPIRPTPVAPSPKPAHGG